MANQKYPEAKGVLVYLQESLRTIDGLSVVLTILFSIVFAIDITLKLGIFRLNKSEDLSSALLILLFSPFLTFLIMIQLRQFSAYKSRLLEIIRALMCLAFYFYLNI